MQKLIDVLVREGATLEKEFAAASSLGEGTSQEVAEFRENALRSFVGRFYPSPYHVVKGKVHDSFGTDASASIDCLVVNPAHPNLIDSHGKFQLLLADGVDVAMELKPDLASRAELHRGLEQGVSIKKLRRAKGAILLQGKAAPEDIEESKRIPYLMLAHAAKVDIHSTIREIDSWYTAHRVPAAEQVDAIGVLGSGVIWRSKYPQAFMYSGLSHLRDEEKVGWFFESWGHATLAGVLLHMEFSYHSTAAIQESVMRRYIRTFQLPHVQRVQI